MVGRYRGVGSGGVRVERVERRWVREVGGGVDGCRR